MGTKVDHETDEPDDESPSLPDWFKRGQTIGRYLVRECLGVGGMGVIYSAWDPQLDRKLAIKVVRLREGHPGSERGRIRLQREGQALARLRHPNVIAVHDVGTEDGRVFVAMEYVEGQTLQRWLTRSPKPTVPALITVFLQIGRGLAAAHRAGLVHRDVKPENVMIGDDGRVLVLDFGIAREEFGSESDVIEDLAAPARETSLGDDDDDADDQTDPPADAFVATPRPLTRSGAVVGTPAYMSPEQHRGRPVDQRGDQFSFCVAMWEALGGEKPFGEGTREKLLARMRLGQIKRFTNRKVPRRVVVALRRGLAWNPGDRYPSMEVLLEALNPRRHGAETRLWFGLGIGAVIGMSVGIMTALSSIGLRSRAVVEPPASSCSDERADAAAAEPALVFPATSQRAAELTRELDRLAGELDQGHEQLERSRQLTAAARELGHPPVLSRALQLQASALERDGEAFEAEVLLREAATLAAVAGDLSSQAELMIATAEMISVQGRHAEARSWLELADGTATRAAAGPGARGQRVRVAIAVARIDRREGQLARARASLETASERLERDGDPHMQLPSVLLELGAVCVELRAFPRAVLALRRALQVSEQAYGPAHLQVAETRHALGRALEASGELDAALGEYERALSVYEQLESGGRTTAVVRSQIGALLAARGDCDRAWAPLVRAVEDARTAAPASLTLASALEALALACVITHPDALALALEAVEIRERLQGLAHPDLATPLALGALALLETDDPVTALALIERASQLSDTRDDAPSAVVSAARGLTLVALGRADEAREPLDHAHAQLNPASELATRVDRARATRG
ncbi:serine/threonine-protein kinase [Enhygromyxa salina]|uniref:serine/threonine-protein kinase n=1 Tax=Enhygromyxa salina TaxID=215803 RepID=UPI000D02FF3D|nr:serine/threonine-protein kinase [Enhygromyxa salina]